MTQPGPNVALSQNFMMLGLLVASENANKHTNTQDSCFISIDIFLNKTADIEKIGKSYNKNWQTLAGIDRGKGGFWKKGWIKINIENP